MRIECFMIIEGPEDKIKEGLKAFEPEELKKEGLEIGIKCKVTGCTLLDVGYEILIP